MSSIGIKPEEKKQPTQLPSVLDITTQQVQPGNKTSAAPNVPVATPPNVNGGPAEFSSLTESVQQIVTSKQSEISATIDALKANSAVDQSAQASISEFQQKTLGNYENIQKANQLPGGAGGGLAKIIGLFDSDYNLKYQTTEVQMNEMRAKSIADTASAIKTQNNALPALLGKVSEAAKVVFDAQKDVNTLAIQAGTLEDKQNQTRLSAARLRVELSQEARAAGEFKIRSMSTAQLAAVLPQAQAGKGQYAHMAGLIEQHLTSELSAQAALGSAQNALKKGNREEYNSSLTDMISHIPLDAVKNQLVQAQKTGSPVVDFPTGEIDPATKKPGIIQVPIDIVQAGILKSAELDKKADEMLAADYTQKQNVIPNMTNLMNTSNAFASMDPRATQIATQLGSVAQNMDPKNPASVRQTAMLLENLKGNMKVVVDENAAKFGTKEAQAAVKAYGANGKFDAVGGTAVVADSIGIPALSYATLYKPAWQTLNNQLAEHIQRNNLTSSSTTTLDPNSASGAQQILAQFLQKPSGKQSMGEITAQILADPANQKIVASKIKGTIQSRSTRQILYGMSQGKGANPFWNEVLQHPQKFQDADGKMSPAKLFETFEQQSLLSNGKIDYAEAFLSAMKNFAVNADNAASSDPAYTLQDHALEASIFGGSPNQAVLGDLHYNLRVMAEKQHANMQSRIREDITGETQRKAAANNHFGPQFDAFFGPAGIITDFMAEKFKAKTGTDVNQVPSATGTGLTVAQIKAMYGNSNGGK